MVGVKKAVEEADGEKALKQITESTLQEKEREVIQAKKRVAAAKRAWDFAERKLKVLKGKLEGSDTKLAQALSVIMTQNTELGDLKRMLDEANQNFYDMGFDDAECSAAIIIKEAQVTGFTEGWVPLTNVIPLLEPSQRDSSNIPLLVFPEDDGPSFQHILEEIESHAADANVVIVENPNLPATP